MASATSSRATRRSTPAAGRRRKRRLQVLRPRPQPGRRLRPRAERRPAPASTRFVVSSSEAHDGGRRPRRRALERDLQRRHRLRGDRQPERRLRPHAAPAAAGPAPGEHDLRQPPRRARRPRTAGRNGEAGDQGPGPVPSRTAARSSRGRSQSSRTCASPSAAPATPTTRPNCSAALPAVQQRASNGLPPRRRRDRRLPAQPQLRPRLHAGHLQRDRQASARSPPTTTATATTSARQFSGAQPLQLQQRNRRARTDLAEPAVRRLRQLRPGSRRRCPGGATPARPDGSNPFVEPPFTGADVSPSECNPADVPPGP